MKLRLGTRGSALALAQSGMVAEWLTRAGHDVERIVIKTTGDKILDVPLAAIGGKGLFTKEIEEALLDRRIDLAVHSLKDVPSVLPEGLVLGAYPPRADARDAFVGRTAPRLDALARGAHVGTSSLRRICQLRATRPDLAVEMLRGNVDTRLRKLDAGDYDAVLLACAGLERLGLGGRVTEVLDADRFVPAAGQGILAIENRAGDEGVLGAARALGDAPTAAAAACERAFLSRLEGGCQVPMGAHARRDGAVFRVAGFVGNPDGTRILRNDRVIAVGPGEVDEAVAAGLGDALARDLLDAGAGAILDALRAGPFASGSPQPPPPPPIDDP